MPWSAKAQELLRQQYAPTGAAARAALPVAIVGIQWWEELTSRGGEGMVVKPLEFITKGRKEPLRRVHECVFGVLAMESEPVDPRL